jgi:hypothetical protein
MNKLVCLFAIVLCVNLSGCTTPGDDVLKNEGRKKEIFSAIVKDETMSSELMDSLMMKNHGKMIVGVKKIMQNDTMVQRFMIGMIMNMASSDSDLCGKMTLEMMKYPNVMEKIIEHHPISPHDKIHVAPKPHLNSHNH